MNYLTREMTLRDYDTVVALWRSVSGVGLDDDCDCRRGIARYLKRNPGLNFVACSGDTIVGAVLAGHDGRRGYLHHLAVAMAHRKQGIAKALIAHSLRALARQHIAKCNIFLFRTNSEGRSFWQHNAWNPRRDLSVLQKETSE